jgi:hypothetical protein
MHQSSSKEAAENEELMVRKGGLPPLLECHQRKRGQAALPNHEIPCPESLLVCLCLSDHLLN